MANAESMARPAIPAAAPFRAPPEVVLPLPYYLVLGFELVGLIALSRLVPEDSGGQRLSYALGWAGTASMVLMHVYSVRKRVRALWHTGKLSAWLHFHIFMGLQGAMFVTYHSLHLHDAKSIQGANIVMVAIVVASGIFGRYLYAFIPKSLSGERLTAHQIEKELEELKSAGPAAPTPELQAALASYLDAPKLTGRLSIRQLVAEDVRARRAVAELERLLADRKTQLLLTLRSEGEDRQRIEAFVAAARRRALLIRRFTTLSSAERVFRNWTVLHKPLTYALLGATVLHVLAHYMFSSGMGA